MTKFGGFGLHNLHNLYVKLVREKSVRTISKRLDLSVYANYELFN